MSETAVLEEPRAARERDAKGRLLPKDAPPPQPEAQGSIFNIDVIQNYLDSLQKDMDLPAVEMGHGVFQPIDLNRTAPKYKRQDGTEAGGTALPQRACEVDPSGNVIPFSGAVVTPELLEEFQRRVLSRLESILQRTHSDMVSGGVQTPQGFIVQKRDQTMRFRPDLDDF